MRYMFANVASLSSLDVSFFNISALTDATGLLSGSAFSNTNYDKLLLSWSQQTFNNNVTFHAGNAQYTEPTARGILTTAGWIITDGGPA